jgi:hypothetical protein
MQLYDAAHNFVHNSAHHTNSRVVMAIVCVQYSGAPRQLVAKPINGLDKCTRSSQCALVAATLAGVASVCMLVVLCVLM